MKKLTFIDNFINKSSALFFIIAVAVVSRFIGQFLIMYHNDNPLYKSIVWLFTPYGDIHIFWALLIIIVAFSILVYIEYAFKKLNEDLNQHR